MTHFCPYFVVDVAWNYGSHNFSYLWNNGLGDKVSWDVFYLEVNQEETESYGAHYDTQTKEVPSYLPYNKDLWNFSPKFDRL